jgi:tripartite-type tricarboxylate transporter receptor subunit TctC
MKRRELPALLATPALAQPWRPERPIEILVGFAPGGGTDLVARAMATRMSDALGQPIVVENKPGASGMLAAELVIPQQFLCPLV